VQVPYNIFYYCIAAIFLFAGQKHIQMHILFDSKLHKKGKSDQQLT